MEWIKREEDLEEVKNIDNVTNAERMLNVTTSIKDTDINLDTMFVETNEISKMYVSEGVAFDGESGIWIDKYLADNNGLKVGDTITITYEQYELTEVIKGLIYTPDHVYNIENEASVFPDHEKYGYCYLSINELPEEYQIFNQIIVDVNDTEKIDTTKMNLTENIESIIAILEREDNISYAGYKSESEEGETYSVVFTLLFVFIAVLSVITTMNRFIKKERPQIGTLKALGFKDKQIKEIFVKQNVWITIVAIIIGLPLGYILVDYVYTHAIGDNFDFKVVVNLLSYLYAIIGTTVVSLIVNKFLARKVKTIDMVTSLKGNE